MGLLSRRKFQKLGEDELQSWTPFGGPTSTKDRGGRINDQFGENLMSFTGKLMTKDRSRGAIFSGRKIGNFSKLWTSSPSPLWTPNTHN